jgi:2-hydroxychromene-2-carboxylate isomerase
MTTPTGMAVQFYFDPGCPWTWITSRWLVEVAERRDLQITWSQFSLRYHNRNNPAYDWVRDELDDQHPGMRVLAATQQQHGNAAVGRLYTALGTLIHHDDDEHLVHLADGIAAAGLPSDLIDAGMDPKWDAMIEASTEAARALVGDAAGVPIIVVDGAEATYFGPVLSPAPTGDEALELWDAFVTLGRIRGLYEIRRARTAGWVFGPRPVL